MPTWCDVFCVGAWLCGEAVSSLVCGVCGVFRAAQSFRIGFSYVLRRPSLLLPCAGYALVEPLVGFSYVAVPAVPVVLQSVLPQVPLRLFCAFSCCVCLSCSCAGGVGWAAAFHFVFSVLLLRGLACRGSLGAAPCEGGSALAVVTSLCLVVLWCPKTTPRLFRTLLVVMFGFDFVPSGGSQPLWVLCSVLFFGLPLLPGRCASGLRCLVPTLVALFVQSPQSFVVGSPSAVYVCPTPALAGPVVWMRSLLYPPAAPVGCAHLGSLMRHSVPLASCRTLSFCCFSPGFLPLAFVQAWVCGLRSWVWILPSFFWGGGGSPLSWLF